MRPTTVTGPSADAMRGRAVPYDRQGPSGPSAHRPGPPPRQHHQPVRDIWWTPWQRWWLVGAGLSAATFVLLLLVGAVVASAPDPDVPGAVVGFYAAMALFSGSTFVLVVDGVVAWRARQGKQGSLRYFTDSSRHTAVRAGVLVVGGALFPVVGAVTGLVLPLVVVWFLLKVFLGGGGASGGGGGSCGRCNGTGQRTDWHPKAGSFPVRCAWCNGTGSSR